MLINKINNFSNINFKENVISKGAESQNAILMLRDPNASVKFQQNQEFAKNADTVNTNPFKSLGYKLYRTFSMIKENEQTQTNGSKQFHAIA